MIWLGVIIIIPICILLDTNGKLEINTIYLIYSGLSYTYWEHSICFQYLISKLNSEQTEEKNYNYLRVILMIKKNLKII